MSDETPTSRPGEYPYQYRPVTDTPSAFPMGIGTPPPPDGGIPSTFFTKPRFYETRIGKWSILSVALVFLLVLGVGFYSCVRVPLVAPVATATSAPATFAVLSTSTYPATATYPATSTTIPGHAAPTPWPTHTPFPTYTPYPAQATPTLYPGQPTYTPLPGQPTYTPIPQPPTATSIPPTATAIPIKTFDDTLADFSHTFAHDTDLVLFGGGGVMQGDSNVVYRQSVANDAITWHFDNTVSAQFTCYYQPSEAIPTHQAFAISSDGSNFTPISAAISGPFFGVGQWNKYTYTVAARDANYVQMIWQSQVANGSPECGDAAFTYQS